MRKYSSTIPPLELELTLTAGATTATLVDGSSLPVIASPDTLTLVLSPDTENEEIVTVTAHSSGADTITIARGQESTTDRTHSSGATVKHMVTARDLQEPHRHISASNYSENNSASLHGLGSSDGSVVGTAKIQTLTNKTIDSADNTITVAQSRVTGLTDALAAKAPLASPALTGTPTAPTATTGTNTTQVATTAFVKQELDAQTHTLSEITDVTVSATEVNYLDGATSNIQDQLDAITSSGLQVRTGTASVSVGSGAANTASVTFGTAFPSGSAPTIILSLTSTHSGTVVISSSSPSTSGFTFRGYAATAGTISVNYLAVQV
jgi:hypothetical protein